MKWLMIAMLGVAILLLSLEVQNVRNDHERLECYIGQQFAYADSLMLICDADPGLAWAKVADDAHTARTIMTTWLSKQPWREEMREHAWAANQNLLYCRFLHAKVESLAEIVRQ